MMDRKEQGRLIEILEMEYMETGGIGDTAFEYGRKRNGRLEEVRSSCRKHLSGARSACLDELIDAIGASLSKRRLPIFMEMSRELLRCLLEELRREKEIKKEIVFLPVKAAMWDSMESIWRAAKSDRESCNVYVVPLPYYEKNPDDSPKEWHCERDLFPEEVSAMDWRELDLEAMHPDIIFIHSPYDNANLVTSVDPRYYSEHLKGQTELLVYVDYGIPIWTPRDCSKFDPRASGAYSLPVHWHADVLVAYSREFASLLSCVMESLWQDVGDWALEEVKRQKIATLGSAKFDKAVMARREDSSLPEEWQHRIGGRKVLLYSLTLHVEDVDDDEFLGGIREVIETVSAREDIVLWWRPHPLLESTLHRKAPEIVDEYEAIVADFREGRKGIYDDTADLYRALAWSDGCLTWESSLSWLCLAVGMPFTICKPSRLRKGFRVDEGKTFREPLLYRIANMKAGKGANLHPENPRWNFCIWWDNFVQEDLLHNIRYGHFLERFLHFIVHPEEYPEAADYRELQMQIFRDFAENPDGTAGMKIYEYCKGRVV
ncbi:MAG: hypothetical protein IJT01_07355 [Selenomonadaceae bacterium]|nr:hypothetical protein [Selenomonadaceae bacterium]